MATNNIIEIIVRVTDLATAQLSKVAAQINTLGTSVTGLFPKLSGMAKRWLALGGATTLLASGISVVSRLFAETAKGERIQTQLAAAVRSTGGAAGYTVKQLNAIAEGLARVTVHSGTAVSEMQSMLLTFTNVRGDNFKAAGEAAANLSARLGYDLTSAARLVGRALNEPTQGLYALTRAGITFSQQQRDVIRDLVASGQKTKAQAVILRELETRLGGAAAALRGTYSGALQAVQNRFNSLFHASESALEPATKGLNDLEAALHAPGLKAGFNAIFAWFVEGAAQATKFGIVVAKLFAKIGEVLSGIAVLTNSTGDVQERLNRDIERGQRNIEALKRELTGLERSNLGTAWSKKQGKLVPTSEVIAEVQADIATMEGLVEQWGQLQQDLIDVSGGGKLKPPPLTSESEELLAAIEGSIPEFEKQQQAIKDSIATLEAYVVANQGANDATLKFRGTSRERFDEATASLARLKQALARMEWEKFLAGWKGVSTELERIKSGMTDAERALFESTETDIERLARQMQEFRANLEIAFEKGWLGSGAEAARLFNERWQFYLDKTLEDVKVTATKMTVPLQELTTAGKRAVENLQDAFTDFFMNLDIGFKGLLRNVLGVFQRILAEAVSLRLMKLLGIEEMMKRAEAPGRAQARAWAEGQFAKISVGGPGERPPPEVETAAQMQARRIVEDIKAHAAIEGTTAAVEGSTAAIKGLQERTTTAVDGTTSAVNGTTAAVNQLHEVVTAKMLADDPCACFRNLVDALGDRGEVGDGADDLMDATTRAIEGAFESIEVPDGGAAAVMDATTQAVESAIGDVTVASEDVSVAVDATTQAIEQTNAQVEASGAEVAKSVGDSADRSSGRITNVLGGLLSRMLAALMSRGGSSGDGDWISTIGKAVAMYFGGAAGGGVVPAFAKGGTIPSLAAGGLVRVGEEGPELALLPGGTRVYNQRQLQFAAGGGATQVNYQPNYNIVIEGNTDPQMTRDELQLLLTARDAKLKAEMANMMREAGIGRRR